MPTDATRKTLESLDTSPKNSENSCWDDIQVTIRHDAVCDLDEVRRSLPILFGPGERHELRALPSGRGRIISADDLNTSCAAVQDVCDQTVYYSLNPIQPDAERASSKTVLSRRWLLIDIDPVRPRDLSATDAEKDLAGEVMATVLGYLANQEWPMPILIDSGNGFHLLYRIDLPADDLSRQIIKHCLKHLAEKFDSPSAMIDQAVHDAPRIAKLPGTWSRKGLPTPERPHRLCRLLNAPEAPKLVPIEKIQAISQLTISEKNESASSIWENVAAKNKGLDAYIQSAVEREGYRILSATEGTRNIALFNAALSIGTMTDWPEMDVEKSKAQLIRDGERAGLTPRECVSTVNSGWKTGSAKPRKRPIIHDQKHESNGHSPVITVGGFIVWAQTIKPRMVEWLDPGRIPIGKMTTFAGQTGLGKTFTICDLAARVTQGKEIPFSNGACYQQGKVLIISAEDDADDTIVPRFIELGGDLSRLALLSPECEEKFNLSALELLNGCLGDMGPDVRMVAIDPPTSYLGKVDDHRNAELRGLLRPLRNWARDHRVALIFVTHVNKPAAFKIEAMARVMGSVAWVAAVRSAHMFCPDPMNPTRNLYLPLKVNNAKKRKGLAYEIVSRPGDLATLRWLEEVSMTADEAMNQVTPKKTSGQEAVEWLIGKFREKPEWRSEDLAESAKGECISSWSIFKSPEVRALPIDKKQRVDGNGERFWVWRARLGWPPKPKESTTSAESDIVKPY